MLLGLQDREEIIREHKKCRSFREKINSSGGILDTRVGGALLRFGRT
ncbi:hypothetical protein MPTK2_8g16220 [Marchantia polymorpha subsp. ruderalis]